MQTLKDEMIKEVIQSSVLMMISVDLIVTRQRAFRKGQLRLQSQQNSFKKTHYGYFLKAILKQ